jgi:hypothetical protein
VTQRDVHRCVDWSRPALSLCVPRNSHSPIRQQRIRVVHRGPACRARLFRSRNLNHQSIGLLPIRSCSSPADQVIVTRPVGLSQLTSSASHFVCLVCSQGASRKAKSPAPLIRVAGLFCRGERSLSGIASHCLRPVALYIPNGLGSHRSQSQRTRKSRALVRGHGANAPSRDLGPCKVIGSCHASRSFPFDPDATGWWMIPRP